jgi:hypothetical protein
MKALFAQVGLRPGEKIQELRGSGSGRPILKNDLRESSVICPAALTQLPLFAVKAHRGVARLPLHLGKTTFTAVSIAYRLRDPFNRRG